MSNINNLLVDPRYLNLDDAGKANVLSRYFDKNVASDPRYARLTDEQKQRTQSVFMDKYAPRAPQPQEQLSEYNELGVPRLTQTQIGASLGRQSAQQELRQTKQKAEEYADQRAKELKYNFRQYVYQEAKERGKRTALFGGKENRSGAIEHTLGFVADVATLFATGTMEHATEAIPASPETKIALRGFFEGTKEGTGVGSSTAGETVKYLANTAPSFVLFLMEESIVPKLGVGISGAAAYLSKLTDYELSLEADKMAKKHAHAAVSASISVGATYAFGKLMPMFGNKILSKSQKNIFTQLMERALGNVSAIDIAQRIGGGALAGGVRASSTYAANYMADVAFGQRKFNDKELMSGTLESAKMGAITGATVSTALVGYDAIRTHHFRGIARDVKKYANLTDEQINKMPTETARKDAFANRMAAQLLLRAGEYTEASMYEKGAAAFAYDIAMLNQLTSQGVQIDPKIAEMIATTSGFFAADMNYSGRELVDWIVKTHIGELHEETINAIRQFMSDTEMSGKAIVPYGSEGSTAEPGVSAPPPISKAAERIYQNIDVALRNKNEKALDNIEKTIEARLASGVSAEEDSEMAQALAVIDAARKSIRGEDIFTGEPKTEQRPEPEEPAEPEPEHAEPEPKPQEPPSSGGAEADAGTDIDRITSLINKAKETLDPNDIAEAQKQAADYARMARTDEAMDLRRQANELSAMKEKAEKKKAEPIKPEPETKDDLDEMTWADLQKEAKALGIERPHQIKKDKLKEKIREERTAKVKRAEEAEAHRLKNQLTPDESKDLSEKLKDLKARAKGTEDIAELKKLMDEAKQLPQWQKQDGKTIIFNFTKEVNKKIGELTPDTDRKKTDQSAGMKIKDVNKEIDRRDPKESGTVPKERIGKKETVVKANKEMDITYALVPIDELVTSHDEHTFQRKDDFPQELQNRSREDTREIVVKTARDLDPKLLTSARVASDGRPIVVVDSQGRMIVMSGNRRTMALKLLNQGEYGTIDKYTEHIKDELNKFGIKDQDTEGMALVGIYHGEADLIELSRLLNEPETQDKSVTDTAASDATLIANMKQEGTDIIGLIDLNTQGIMTEANEKFIEAFLDEIAGDRTKYVSASGEYTVALQDRIENALFMYVFNNDPKAKALLSSLKEAGDSPIKSISKAILNNIKQITRLRNMIEKYGLEDYDITKDLLNDITEIARLRKEGIPVAEYADELDFLREGYEAVPEHKVAFFMALAGLKNFTKANEFIGGYYASALMTLNPEQTNIFNDEKTKEEFIDDYARDWLGLKKDDDLKRSVSTSKKGSEGTPPGETPKDGEPGKGKKQPVKMSRKEFARQMHEAQKGKLTKEQIDVQIAVWDTMMETYAKEMGITVDEAYEQHIKEITAEPPIGDEYITSYQKSKTKPKKVKRAYRMGILNEDGTLSPVMVDTKTTKPRYEIGQWYDAEVRKSTMKVIPGFHFAETPSLPQLYKKDGKLEPNRVYYIAEYSADTDYQAEADAAGGYLENKIPVDGYYNRGKMGVGGWAISGKMRPVRVLSMKEVDAINRRAGKETIDGMPVDKLERIQAKTTLKQTTSPEIAEAQRQMEAVREKYENTDKWLKAPNGKPTNLTERQWLQVRTPSFKTWFGDWENDPKNASKVVDENGEPRVVYHGTGATDKFSRFEVQNTDKWNLIDRLLGSHFSADPEIANSFAEIYPGEAALDGRVYPVFLNILNPQDVSSETIEWDQNKISNAVSREVFSQNHDLFEEALGTKGMDARYSELDTFLKNHVADFSATGMNQRIVAEYKKQGKYDGLIYENTSPSETRKARNKTCYIAYSPNQIKSATGNVGTYGETPNILEQSSDKGSINQIIQGYIQPTKDGKYRIGFLAPDFSTGLHEQAHLARKMITKLAETSPYWARLQTQAEEWSGAKDGVWTVEAEEKFAKGFEKYILEGHAPNAKMKTIFAKMKEWMRQLLSKIKELAGIKLDKNIIEVYEALFGKKAKPASNKATLVKNKFMMEQALSTDPGKLTEALDKVGDHFGCITERAGLGRNAGILMRDLDSGKILVSIDKVKDGYNVNGFHVANNGEAISMANDLLEKAGTLKQTTSPEIAEARRQMDEVRKKYEGTDKWLKAPNGKPTNLTEQQWIETRTENFKKKFGDWENDPKNATKVIDENGEPRAVWHGTEDGGFTEFSKDKLGSYTGAPSARRGFFFAGKESTSAAYRGEGKLDISSYLNEVIEEVESIAFYATRMLSDIGVRGYYGDYSDELSFDIRHMSYKYSGDHKGYEDAIISLVSNIESDLIDNAKNILAHGYSQADIDEAMESLRGIGDAMDGVRTDFSFGDPDETMYNVFLNIRNPIEYDYEGRERWASFDKMLSIAQEQGNDGAIFKNIKDGGALDDIFVAFEPTQIKSATGNVGTYSNETANILYQASQASNGAVDVDRAARRRAEAQDKTYRSARRLKSMLAKTDSVHAMTEALRAATGTWIRLAYPGARPISNDELGLLHFALSQEDPNSEEGKKLLRYIKRREKENEKFRTALYENSGYGYLEDIPFEELYRVLSNINPVVYDKVLKDESMELFVSLIPTIKKEFAGRFKGEEAEWRTLQQLMNAIMKKSPGVGRATHLIDFLSPQRYLVTSLGKAGYKIIDYAYKGSLKLAEMEAEVATNIREMLRLQDTNNNHRGRRYKGDSLAELTIILSEVHANQDISDSKKVDIILERTRTWNEAHPDDIINELDIVGLHEVSRELLVSSQDMIMAFNYDQSHDGHINIREDYGDPRVYDWNTAAHTSVEDEIILMTPRHVRARTQEMINTQGGNYNLNYAANWSGWFQSMMRFMAFYPLGTYLSDDHLRYVSGDKGQEINIGSEMSRDLTKAQISAFMDKNMRRYIRDYAHTVMGIHRSTKKWDKRYAAAKTNMYASALAVNIGVTLLNYNQRNLINSVVDRGVAKQVRKDYTFWRGLFNKDSEKYPTLARVMQTFRVANESVLVSIASESKRLAEGETNRLSKLYYQWTAFNGEILAKSPFSIAEYGNRAYGHAAGVYQVLMNSPEYKRAMANGKTVHEAMEHALNTNPALREAAITYGGIINAEINADASPVFSPMFFSPLSSVGKYATFIRYAITLTNHELRTFFSSSELMHQLSPDLFKLATSGDVNAASTENLIQAGLIFVENLSDENIDKMVGAAKASNNPESDLIYAGMLKKLRGLIQESLDTVKTATEKDFEHIVRGRKGKIKTTGGLLGFTASEIILRFLLNTLLAMLPWWQKKSPLDENIKATDLLESFQSTKIFGGDFRLGAGIFPSINFFYGSDKSNLKAMVEWLSRIMPGFGVINQLIRTATGKVGTDYIIDEIYDIME